MSSEDIDFGGLGSGLDDILKQAEAAQQPPMGGPAEKLRKGSNEHKAALGEAIATAQAGEPVSESKYMAALEFAQQAVAQGTPLDSAMKAFVRQLGATPTDEKAVIEHGHRLKSSIRQLQELVMSSSVSDAERNAIIAALTQPNATVQVPDTAATKSAIELLKGIEAQIRGIKTPPSLKRYSSGMLLRPAGEVAGSVLEGGLSTLIVTSILTTMGIPIAAHSLAHLVTYGASAVGWNILGNVGTKTAILGHVADTGSIKKGVKRWSTSDRRGTKKVTKMATIPLRLASVGILIAGGIAVAQQVLSRTDESGRNAALLAEPLRQQGEKVSDFTLKLKAFAPVLPKILEIAKRIESGKKSTVATAPAAAAPAQKNAPRNAPAGAPKQQQAAPRVSDGWIAYTAAEIDAIKKNELEPLFKAAGLDLALLSQITFNQPKTLGQGPAYEFKKALETGDTSNLRDLNADDFAKLKQKFGNTQNVAEMVGIIRTKMGLATGQTFESRLKGLIDSFIQSKELAQINADLDEALRISSVIHTQGESVQRTFLAAFVEGTPPIGIEAVQPYIQSILEKRDALKKVAKESIADKITQALTVQNDALSAVGGSVSSPALPEWTLNMSPLEALKKTIEDITEQAAGAAAADTIAKSSVRGVFNSFIPGLPGSQKALGSERYVAKFMLQNWSGYRVVNRGERTFIYERINAGAREGFSTSAADAWNSALFGTDGRAEVEKAFPSNLDLNKATSLSDDVLGAELLPLVKAIAERIEKMSAAQPNNKIVSRALNEIRNMTSMNPASLGKLLRPQVGIQFGANRVPLAYPPSAWSRIVGGEVPPETGIDAKLWADTVAKADPSFAQSLVANLSQISDAELGAQVAQHLSTIIPNLEKSQSSGYMLRQYRAMLSTFSSPNQHPQLGALARKQLAYQIEKKMSPPTIFPQGVWSVVLDPSLAESSEEVLDPSVWRALPDDKAKELFTSYLKSAQLQAFGALSGLVLLLSLGTFSLSIFAVRNRNKNLLKTKDRFVEDWHNVERNIVEALQNFNEGMRTLPFFSSLPPLEPYMMLAALRKLGEEYSEDVREDRSAYEAIKHDLKEIVSKGPYAQEILEIFSMEKLLGRLQSDPKAVRKLQDILAPGLAEFADIAGQVTMPDDKRDDPMGSLLVAMNAMDLSGKEMLRNAARGHLRFRQEVARARLVLNERSQAELTKTQEMETLVAKAGNGISIKDAAAADVLENSEAQLLERLVSNNGESVRFDNTEMLFDSLVEKLDTDALAETMLSRYKQPRAFSRRKAVSERAETSSEIEIPTEGQTLREFSLVAGLANDEKVLLERADASGNNIRASFQSIWESTQGVRDEFAQNNPGQSLDMRVSVTSDGDTVFMAVALDDASQSPVKTAELPTDIFAEALTSPFIASEKIRQIVSSLN